MNTTWNSEDSFWKRTIVYSAAAAVVVVGGGALYYFKVMRGGKPAEVQTPVAVAPAKPEASAEPEHHPLPASPDAKPLPALNDSDPSIADELAGVFGKKSIEQLLVPEQVVRHIVVTIDNLPRTKVAEQMRPVKPTGGETVTVANGDTITLSADNYARYAPVIKLVQNTSTPQLGALYLRYYPLLQQSYEDLGYPGMYFNDRVVQVIDHLLQTPDLRGPIELKQGKVFYEYADPALESRSAGQKLLMRMGPDNAAAIKKKLRELKTFVTTSQDPPDAQDAAPASGTAAPPPARPESSSGPTPQPLPNDEAKPSGPSR